MYLFLITDRNSVNQQLLHSMHRFPAQAHILQLLADDMPDWQARPKA